MIPFRDTVPLQNTPWVTWTLILVNLLMFLYVDSLEPDAERAFQYLHGLVAARYMRPDWAAAVGFPEDYMPFVTSMFLHGSWLHLIFNMWLLWIFGDNIEDRMGGVRFVAFYLLCGLIAGLTHIYANPISTVPTIGASGAVAGVMGAYFFLFPYARIVIWVLFLPIFVEVPAIAFLGIWVIIQLYKVTTALGTSGYSDVAWFGHLGGILAGMFLYRPFLLPSRQRSDFRSHA
ncbi:rhomboid family intramembrane serine protease [Methyloparacoccus murrellii]|jgi:membrane associated rhomboid family serine protease